MGTGSLFTAGDVGRIPPKLFSKSQHRAIEAGVHFKPMELHGLESQSVFKVVEFDHFKAINGHSPSATRIFKISIKCSLTNSARFCYYENNCLRIAISCMRTASWDSIMADKSKSIVVQDVPVRVIDVGGEDYISLTDMTSCIEGGRSTALIQNWMRTYSSIEFLGLWELLYNPDFKPLEFEGFKNEAGSNTFTLSPSKWISSTGAKGMTSKAGRYGGTYAHRYIAFEFGTWLSPEFKFYLVHEFDRLKALEQKHLSVEWDLQRTLAKINYRIHTDAVKAHLIPAEVTGAQARLAYASEGDLLNVALFGMTAGQWRTANLDAGKKANIRDGATLEQLVVLSNMESINALLIEQGLSQGERLVQLNKTAITQMTSLVGNQHIARLSSGKGGD